MTYYDKQMICRLDSYGWTKDQIKEFVKVSDEDIDKTVSFAKLKEGEIEHYSLWCEYLRPLSLRDHCLNYLGANYENLASIPNSWDIGKTPTRS